MLIKTNILLLDEVSSAREISPTKMQLISAIDTIRSADKMRARIGSFCFLKRTTSHTKKEIPGPKISVTASPVAKISITEFILPNV